MVSLDAASASNVSGGLYLNGCLTAVFEILGSNGEWSLHTLETCNNNGRPSLRWD